MAATVELEVKNIETVYRSSIQVLKGLSLQLRSGEISALLGPNGSGKSTTLKAVSGLLPGQDGKIIKGSIEFRGKSLVHAAPEDIVRLGIVQVMQGRRVFGHLTVDENLRVAGSLHGAAGIREGLEQVFEVFPRLRDLRNRTSGYLSGGEQQMLVIGRGLMAKPKLLLLDEPSLGLSPYVIEEMHAAIRRINRELAIPMMLVEQNAWAALNIADYAYVMDGGRIVLDGPADKVKEDKDVVEFHLGISEQSEKKSYWDVKHYKRRKRWLG